MYEANWMKERAYEFSGLEEYNDCWTFEPRKRPIPFVATDSKPERALELFSKYAPILLDFLLPHVVPHTQTYNKVSAIGYPVNENPVKETQIETSAAVLQVFDDLGLDKKYLEPEATRGKMSILNALFTDFDNGDIRICNKSFTTIGGRLQTDPPDKVREHLFITSKGVIYKGEVTRADRTEYVKEIGRDMIGSRYRGVNNPAVINLYNQCWDSMLHNAIMKFPLCDSNMYNKVEWPGDIQFTTFDFKHFERYMGKIVLAYADMIGGRYGEWLTKIVHDPLLVKSDDDKAGFLITPIFTRNQYPQFGSGLSPVATIGKLTNLVSIMGYLHQVEGVNVTQTAQVALSGEYGGLRFWMYGDDNRIAGPKSKRDAYVAWQKEVFDVEVDQNQAIYLGMIYRDDIKRFVLPFATYNKKLYNPERDHTWRTYPHLGNVERRNTFREYGEPEIGSSIIPYENGLFDETGHPYQEMIADAQKERMLMERAHAQPDKKFLTDKEYLMTDSERLASGMFWGLSPERTKQIVLSLVSENIKSKLKI